MQENWKACKFKELFRDITIHPCTNSPGNNEDRSFRQKYQKDKY